METIKITTEDDFKKLALSVITRFNSPPDTAGDFDYLSDLICEFFPKSMETSMDRYCERMSKWGYEFEDLLEEVLAYFEPTEINKKEFDKWMDECEKDHEEWLDKYHKEWKTMRVLDHE